MGEEATSVTVEEIFEQFVDEDPTSYDSEIKEILEQHRQIKELLGEIRQDNLDSISSITDKQNTLIDYTFKLCVFALIFTGLFGVLTGLELSKLFKGK